MNEPQIIEVNSDLGQIQPDSTNPFLSEPPKPRKRKIPERTRWSSRQKSVGYAHITDLPPRLSPIPRRQRRSNSPLPILSKEGELSQTNETTALEPSTSQNDQTFGTDLEKGGIKCNVCDKVFKTRPSFNAHRINKHNIVVRVGSPRSVRRV